MQKDKKKSTYLHTMFSVLGSYFSALGRQVQLSEYFSRSKIRTLRVVGGILLWLFLAYKYVQKLISTDVFINPKFY